VLLNKAYASHKNFARLKTQASLSGAQAENLVVWEDFDFGALFNAFVKVLCHLFDPIL
jgi:hypothetical protein